MKNEQENNNGIIDQLVNYIKKVFESTGRVSGPALDKELIALARSEEEAELVKEMCENVDLYYTKREEFRQSGMEAGEWFEKEIERTVKDVYPEAGKEELDEVKSAVSEAMDSEIETIMNLVDEEISPVSEILTKEK